MRRARLWAVQLIATIFVFAAPALGQTSWWRTYGGEQEDRGYSVQQTSDGGYIIAGYTSSYGAGNGDVYLIKTNASGNTLWTRTYGGTGVDFGIQVDPTSDGGSIIAGFTGSFGPGTPDSDNVYLVKTDASGDTQWTRTYGGTGDDEGLSFRQTADGGYIVAGWTKSLGAGSGDVYLIKTDASGDTLWTRTYGGTGDDEGLSVRQTADGGYIVAGWTKSFGAGSGDVYLIKTDASGDTLWTRTYGSTSQDGGSSVQQTSDGGYIVAGCTQSFGTGAYNVYLVKTEASGDTQWTRTYGGTDYDVGGSVEPTSDGGYIIAGWTGSFSAGYVDAYVIKTDANGNVAVEEPPTPQLANSRTALRVQPNPFSSFAAVPGHETERFVLSDVSGRMVGICKGDRIGEGLAPGVYFLSPVKPATPRTRLLRIVKGG